ncbi:FecR family protein [Roseibium sp. LAB1]
MRFAPVFIVLLLSIVCSTASLADKVGITVDASKTVKATGGSDARILASMTSIFRNDRLRANSSGNAQIRLIDGTKIVVGPNADVKIDDFVITGQTVSKLTVSATRGAFRFISGRSKSSAYSIRTPNGTIGVRGTAFDVTITPQGTNVALLRGTIKACDRSGRCQIVRNRCDYVLIGRRGVKKDRVNSDSLRNRSKSLFPLLVNESNLNRQFRQRGSGCTVKNARLAPDRVPEQQPRNIFRALFSPRQPTINPNSPERSSPEPNSPEPSNSVSSSPEPAAQPGSAPASAGVPNNPGNGNAVGNAGEKFSNGSRGNSSSAPGQSSDSPGRSGSTPGENRQAGNRAERRNN